MLCSCPRPGSLLAHPGQGVGRRASESQLVSGCQCLLKDGVEGGRQRQQPLPGHGPGEGPGGGSRAEGQVRPGPGKAWQAHRPARMGGKALAQVQLRATRPG